MRIKRCSICGSEPKLTSADMGRGNGHGYPGSTEYDLKCPKCEMIKVSTCDIYDGRDGDTEVASDRVIRFWNEKCLEVNAHLTWREEQERINPFVKDLLLAFVEGEDEILLTDKMRAKLVLEVEKL